MEKVIEKNKIEPTTENKPTSETQILSESMENRPNYQIVLEVSAEDNNTEKSQKFADSIMNEFYKTRNIDTDFNNEDIEVRLDTLPGDTLKIRILLKNTEQ
ncbi:MAG: hypothetical protein LBE91_04200 [Tannerella sp.]|nr:hypothetical protein [Tannerella sp.]